MGKKRAQKDRMYVSATEHQQSAAGYKQSDSSGGAAGNSNHSALPFDRCALTLKPWAADAVCTAKEGWCCFDLLALTPYLQQHRQHPVFHTPLHARDLLPLHFHANTEGQYIDPVTYQVLTDNSHIVALRPTGNVYLYSTIHEMCIKQKSMLDLIDGTRFAMSDIITLQNPNAAMPKFKHTGHERQAGAAENKAADDGVKRAKPNATSAVSNEGGSVTSTATVVKHEAQTTTTSTPTDDDIRQSVYMKLRSTEMRGTKAYARLHTTFGNLNLRIHCALVPAVSHNWLQLAADGRYDRTEFHRVISGFMAQGGKSIDGTDRAAFGPTVVDEFHDVLRHDARGVIAMANKGKETSQQQFYITFKECQHLDNKHSVFADLVGDMSPLDKLEQVAVDDADRPLQQILITSVTIFDEPYTKLLAQARGETVSGAKQAASLPAKTTALISSDATASAAPPTQPKATASLPAPRMPAPKAAAPSPAAASKLYTYDQW